LKYDNVFHNYLIVHLDDGHYYVIEKNAVVEARKARTSDTHNVEKHAIPLNGRTNNLETLINTASKDNPQEFWQYNARKKQ
jgi:hypothetical protein